MIATVYSQFNRLLEYPVSYFWGAPAPAPAVQETPSSKMERDLLDWEVSAKSESQKMARSAASHKISRCYAHSNGYLMLGGLGLDSLPRCLSELSHLKTLDLTNNDFSELNSDCLPKNLIRLVAWGNKINKSEFLKDLVKLEYVNLSGNQLSGPIIFKSPSLESVNLSSNKLAVFPLFPSGAQLTDLDLSMNDIVVFPADDCLPKVFRYLGALPHSSVGRERLGSSGREIAELSVGGKLIPAERLFKADTPVIGVGEHGTALIMGSKLPSFVKNLGGQPQHISLDGPLGLNERKLTRQTQEGIQELRKTSLGNESLPVALLRTASEGSEIAKIRAYAEACIARVQGLVLPGGGDVEREFYDATTLLTPNRDYGRSLTEFALVLAAGRAKKPVYGICRGAQLINVFLGGTLKSLGGWETGWKLVDVADGPHREEIAKAIDGISMPALSAHSQCCDKIAGPLTVVMKHGDIPKFLISQDRLLIASQIHLEEPFEGQYSIGYRLLKLFADKVPIRSSL